jgi:hypothetical protein|tara:strand:+ start:245 stop:883 length:639 start_codon:yes stop_codon:yes gene_type:complete
MAPKRSREEYTNDSNEENRADDADSEDACDSSSDASGSDSDGDDLAFRVAVETFKKAQATKTKKRKLKTKTRSRKRLAADLRSDAAQIAKQRESTLAAATAECDRKAAEVATIKARLEASLKACVASCGKHVGAMNSSAAAYSAAKQDLVDEGAAAREASVDLVEAATAAYLEAISTEVKAERKAMRSGVHVILAAQIESGIAALPRAARAH